MSDLAELRGANWTRLLAAARRKLERSGGLLEGTIGLADPTDAERRAVIGITGSYRPETVKRLTVSLGELDAALRNAHGLGLPEVLATIGGPLRDRPAERSAEAETRQETLAAARSAMSAAQPWFTPWLDTVAADGTVTRLIRRGDAHLIGWATAVLDRLPEQAMPLPVLAERVTGDTKALVPGSPLATLVLRALALRSGVTRVPGDRAGQRELWESAGVIVDDLASQALILNVRAAADDVVSGWLNDAADFGIPFRLTLHQQATDPIVPSAKEIFVCENPAVLRAAAAELGSESAPLVCTEGVPSAACHKLLAAAVGAGARLRWRADFDWAGLRIVGTAMARHGAAPWRMAAADYAARLDEGESVPLAGSPATSPWDPPLAESMAEQGSAVMEERLIALLLDDLS